MRLPAAILGWLLLMGPVFAQTETQSAAPTTRMEAFQAKWGSASLLGFTEVGSIRGNSGGLITVSARELTDSSNPASSRITGIGLSVEENSRLERENTAFIDADEIDALIQGIEFVSRTTKASTKQDSFEATYRTRGSLSITVFNRHGSDDISAAVSAGRIGKTTVFIGLSELAKLKDLVSLAKSKL